MKQTIYGVYDKHGVFHSHTKSLMGMEFSHLRVLQLDSVPHGKSSIWKCWCSVCKRYELHSAKDLVRYKFEKCKFLPKEDYFASMSIPSSYWAGFIAADGNIKQDGKTLRIKLHKRDSEHLLRFMQEVSPSRDGLEIDGARSQVGLSITSPTICNDLRDIYNVIPNKSLTLLPPKSLPWDNRIAYITGYIDGDGSFGRNINNDFFFHVMGTREIMKYIKETLEKYNIYGLKLNIYPKGRQFCMSSTGKKTLELFRAFAGQLQLPRMSRKWGYV